MFTAAVLTVILLAWVPVLKSQPSQGRRRRGTYARQSNIPASPAARSRPPGARWLVSFAGDGPPDWLIIAGELPWVLRQQGLGRMRLITSHGDPFDTSQLVSATRRQGRVLVRALLRPG